MTAGILTLASACAGVVVAGPAQAAAPAPPCAELPCAGADASAVTSWASAPRVVNQYTLPSGAKIKLMAGKPAWDSATEYTWVDGQLGSVKGKIWGVYEYNVYESAYAYRNIDHPRSHRSTSGTTAMFVKTRRMDGEDAAGCISDATTKACVGGSIETVQKISQVSPCDPYCKIIDLATQDPAGWRFVDRPTYRKMTLPSGAWVQQATGYAKWPAPNYNWAEGGHLPAGGRIWLEEWQGEGRWGAVYTPLSHPNASRTTDGSTHAFAMNSVRACVTDGKDTQCTGNDGDVAPTAQAPCETLPCEGIDPSTVTEWLPSGEPRVIEDANIYQGGRLKIYKGRPTWDPEHTYYWGEAELPPRAGVSAQLMTHEAKGLDGRVQRPVPVPGTQVTASGKTKMFAVHPLAPGDKQIAGFVNDGKTWAFATQQGDNMYQSDREGPAAAPCATQPCVGVTPASVTDWQVDTAAWKSAKLKSGAEVSLRGGRPAWSLTDFYAWAETTGSAKVWLEDKAPGDAEYRKIAEAGLLGATTGELVRACVSDGTETACTA